MSATRVGSRIRLRTAVPLLVLACAFATLILWISRDRPSRSNDGTDKVPGRVSEGAAAAITEVHKGEIGKVLILNGELRAVRSRSIFVQSPQETKITYLAPEGSVVKPGDRLLELDSGTVLQKIKDLEEKIVAADNEILKTRSGQEAALRDMDVQLSQLWLAVEQAKIKAGAPADLIPRRDYQENQLALAKATTEYSNQEAKIDQKKKEQAAELQVKLIERGDLDGQLEKARLDLDCMNVKAPSEGMVIYTEHWDERRKIQVGDVVWGGLPVLQLPDLREMEVFAQVNEVDGPKVAVGQKATIRLDSYGDKQLSGSVREISQTAIKAGWMAKANVFRVAISLDSTMADIMKPGMSVQVALHMGRSDPQLLVPRTAVRFEKEAAEVMRLEANNARRAISVTVLTSDAFHYEVAQNGALKEGDKIIAVWR